MKIIEYLNKRQIEVGKIKFINDKSENILASLNCSSLDAILIDGNHAFPIPFLDWFYTEKKLKVGGLLIIDDTKLWTGILLVDFLKEEPEWNLVKIFHNSAIFRKVADGSSDKWWGEQNFLVNNSIGIRKIGSGFMYS